MITRAELTLLTGIIALSVIGLSAIAPKVFAPAASIERKVQ